VDQLFSCISKGISKEGILTFQALTSIVRRYFTKAKTDISEEGAKPQWAKIDQVYAIREWIFPCSKGLHNLGDFHEFHFVLNKDEECEMLYKPWCSDRFEETEEIYKPIVILKSLPLGIPDLIKPNYDVVNISRLRSMVTKAVDKGAMTNFEEGNWEQFLAKEEDIKEVFEKTKQTVYSKENGKNMKTVLLIIESVKTENTHIHAWPGLACSVLCPVSPRHSALHVALSLTYC